MQAENPQTQGPEPTNNASEDALPLQADELTFLVTDLHQEGTVQTCRGGISHWRESKSAAPGHGRLQMHPRGVAPAPEPTVNHCIP
jgi:hypothetical protein